LEKTKEGGVDFDKVINPKRFGITNNPKTFRSFEEEINQQFPIVPTKPTERLSKRVGVLGYKVGMTHFWDKWGKLTPCTVI